MHSFLARPVEPYRLLFPLGVLFGLWGVLVWIAHAGGAIGYPGVDHANLMVGGFTTSFVAGFVLTALPRFTGTAPATAGETLAVGALLGLGTLAALVAGLTDAGVGALPGLLALAEAIRRRLRRRADGPAPFVLIPLGVAVAVVAAAVPLVDRIVDLDPRIVAGSRILFLHGFALMILIGVGSRLTLMLREQMPRPLVGGRLDTPTERRAFAVVGLLIVAGYAVETLVEPVAGRALVALTVSAVLLRSWRIAERPRVRGPVPVGILLAAWSLAAGLWGSVLWPDARVHWLHLGLVAGISLLVLLVATRVVLSHGGHDTGIERRSRLLWLVVIGIVAAAAARTAGGLGYGDYERHLIYAASTWAACLIAWFALVGRRVGRDPFASPASDH